MTSCPDVAASARWPDVPACYDWLSLDRRGTWRLRGEAVEHAGLAGFLNANYGCDESGNWLVRNGPQRVYVSLDYTPWVLRLHPDGSLTTHAGTEVAAVAAACLDEEGSVVLDTDLGAGLLDDRDLAAFLAECRLADGRVADDEALLAVMTGGSGEGGQVTCQVRCQVRWRNLPLQAVERAAVPARFGFRARPAP
ncbi:DUF2946 family protein [Aromatoleum petrolei]|uniref:DUF2946 family protein n=1 Tax=Aromatoleum petrolei TaxID=76116 RepID=A0ABX1MYY8_9RHOO|nr:DUF2946 family protein [Aromatoleum petrolei]NMF91274.1 DUF2946 family protein [Aromatoleum petrolei]QTQ37055.1 Uncharacterized protein ToN1_29240 [Aromatoleum petrolei]